MNGTQLATAALAAVVVGAITEITPRIGGMVLTLVTLSMLLSAGQKGLV